MRDGELHGARAPTRGLHARLPVHRDDAPRVRSGEGHRALGDPTPRLWADLVPTVHWFEPSKRVRPGAHRDPVAVLRLMMPAAYAKPAPSTDYLRRGPRDVIVASVVGPIVSLILAIAAGWSSEPGPPAAKPCSSSRRSPTQRVPVGFHLFRSRDSTVGARPLLLPVHAGDVPQRRPLLPLFVLVVLFVCFGPPRVRAVITVRSARRHPARTVCSAHNGLSSAS